MDRQQRALQREQIAAYYLDRAIGMRRTLFVGWARSATTALRGGLARTAGLPLMLRALSRPENRHTP